MGNCVEIKTTNRHESASSAFHQGDLDLPYLLTFFFFFSTMLATNMNRKLGKFESAHVLTNENYPFNAVIILRVSSPPPKETLKKALEHMRRRRPLLGVHIKKEKDGYYFNSENTPEIPLISLNRQDENHWRQVAETELNTTIDIFKDAPLRVVCLTGTAKVSEIIFTFQHVVIDAASAANLIEKVLSYCGARTGDKDRKTEKEQEPGKENNKDDTIGMQPLEPLPPAEDLFPEHYRGGRRKWKLLWFLLRQMGDELSYRLRSVAHPKAPVYPEGKGKILSFSMPPETATALFNASRRHRVTANCLFNAAMLKAVHKHLYGSRTLPVRHLNFAGLRPYLEPPVPPWDMGSYFSMMRFTVLLEKSTGIWDLAKKTSDILTTSFKRGDKFAVSLMSFTMMRAMMRFKNFRMSNTALSYTGPLPLGIRYGKTHILDVHAFVSNFVVGPEYTATVRLFDKRLYWDFLYLDSDMDQELARTIADEIRTTLETAIKEEPEVQ